MGRGRGRSGGRRSTAGLDGRVSPLVLRACVPGGGVSLALAENVRGLVSSSMWRRIVRPRNSCDRAPNQLVLLCAKVLRAGESGGNRRRRNDDDTIPVPDDPISRRDGGIRDGDRAALLTAVVLVRATRRNTCREYGEPQLTNPIRVANGAVGHKRCEATRESDLTQDIAEHRASVVPAIRHDDDRAGRGVGNRTAHRKVVSRFSRDRVRRAGRERGRPYRPDAGVED